MGFYSVGKRGTIAKQRFNCRGACKRLYEGMKGFGTNEDAITEVVASHTAKQRQEIKSKYKIMYGKDLIKELDSELSGAFSKLVLALMKDPEEYILECIRNAIVKSKGGKIFKKLKKTVKKGLCADAYTLLSCITGLRNAEIKALRKAYKAKYETEIGQDIGEDFPDEFRALIFAILQAGREDSKHVDLELVQEDIEALNGGGGPGNTKEEYLQSIVEERSWAHLREVFNSYQEVTGESWETFLEDSEALNETMKEAYMAVIKIIRSEVDFYAERLKEAIDGIGTDDDTLINTVVLRAEIDLADIIERYEVLFDKSLEDDVIGDTSGDYQNILLKLLTLPEFDDDSVAEGKVKKGPAVEIQTQTSLVEDDDGAVDGEINAADHDGEGQGHDAEEYDVEEEIIQAEDLPVDEMTVKAEEQEEDDTLAVDPEKFLDEVISSEPPAPKYDDSDDEDKPKPGDADYPEGA